MSRRLAVEERIVILVAVALLVGTAHLSRGDDVGDTLPSDWGLSGIGAIGAARTSMVAAREREKVAAGVYWAAVGLLVGDGMPLLRSANAGIFDAGAAPVITHLTADETVMWAWVLKCSEEYRGALAALEENVGVEPPDYARVLKAEILLEMASNSGAGLPGDGEATHDRPPTYPGAGPVTAAEREAWLAQAEAAVAEARANESLDIRVSAALVLARILRERGGDKEEIGRFCREYFGNVAPTPLNFGNRVSCEALLGVLRSRRLSEREKLWFRRYCANEQAVKWRNVEFLLPIQSVLPALGDTTIVVRDEGQVLRVCGVPAAATRAMAKEVLKNVLPTESGDEFLWRHGSPLPEDEQVPVPSPLMGPEVAAFLRASSQDAESSPPRGFADLESQLADALRAEGVAPGQIAVLKDPERGEVYRFFTERVAVVQLLGPLDALSAVIRALPVSREAAVTEVRCEKVSAAGDDGQRLYRWTVCYSEISLHMAEISNCAPVAVPRWQRYRMAVGNRDRE